MVYLRYPFFFIDHRTFVMFPSSVLVSRSKGRSVVIEGWRVGRNPSPVLGGVQLSGLPAPRAALIGAYLPLHPAGRPFHRFHQPPQRLSTHHSQRRVDVPFLLRCQSSRLAPRGAAVLHGGWSFPRPKARQPPANSPTNYLTLRMNKFF